MKRKQREETLNVYIAGDADKCDACLHIRKGEPYVERWFHSAIGCVVVTSLCWRCCRDAESTFLIQQKWPLAFVRGQTESCWLLNWAPDVQLMRHTDGEIKLED